jgi:hypothetical protein
MFITGLLLCSSPVFNQFQQMKQIIFIPAIFLTTAIAKAQPKQLVAYYQAIYKAENCIMQNRLDSSLHYYQQAFAAWPRPFGRDTYNAAVVASQQKVYIKTHHYLTRLLKLGAKLADIKNTKIFAPFLQSQLGRRFLQQAPSVKPIYDAVYRSQIEALLAADQAFRIKKGSYTLYGDTIKKIDRQNISAFLQLVNEKGFPTEEKVGITSLEGVAAPLYNIIIVHQGSGPLQQYSFASLIKENILTGSIENKAGAYLYNRSLGYNIFDILRVQYVKIKDSTASHSNPNNFTVLEESEWGYAPLTEKEAAQTNTRRAALLLDSYEAHLSKTLFAIKNPVYQLSANGAQSTFTVTKYEDFIAQKQVLKFK